LQPTFANWLEDVRGARSLTEAVTKYIAPEFAFWNCKTVETVFFSFQQTFQ